jgi:hypothetical protein
MRTYSKSCGAPVSKEIKNKIILADLVVTAVLIIAACIGIACAIKRRPDLRPGVVTTDNYKEYLTIDFSVSSEFVQSANTPVKHEYGFKIKAMPYREITELVVELKCSAEYADDLGTITIRPDRSITPDSPYTYNGEAYFTYPFSSLRPVTPDITVKLISVSAKFAYIPQEGD